MWIVMARIIASIFQSGIVAIWIVTGAKNWQAKE
jgi:hypothetical protein